MDKSTVRRQKRSSSGDRRECKRVAARSRREKENVLLNELEEALSRVGGTTYAHIDRIAQLRLAATFTRLRGCVSKLMETQISDSDLNNLWCEELISNCLDGFIIIFDDSGVILYTTENVSEYIGFTQAHLIGCMLRNFVHREDFNDLRKAIIEQKAAFNLYPSIVMRIKSIRSPRGSKLKSASATMKPMAFSLRTLGNSSSSQSLYLLLAIETDSGGNQSMINQVISCYSLTSTFVTRHTYDMKFIFADESLKDHLPLEPKALNGSSFYNLVHPEDLPDLIKSFKDLFKRTSCRTPYYRLIGANDKTIWIQTVASCVSYTARNQCKQIVICVHQVLGKHGEALATPTATITDECSKAVSIPFKAGEYDPSASYGHQIESVARVDSTSVAHQTSSFRRKLKRRTARSARVSRRTKSYDEVFKWLVNDLPESQTSNHNTKQASPAFASSSRQQQQICSPKNVRSKTSKVSCNQDAIPTRASFSIVNENSIDSNDINAFKLASMVVTSPTEQINDAENTDYDREIEGNFGVRNQTNVLPAKDEDTAEMLETLAPFVATGEMLPLDMQNLLCDFNFDEWLQSDQAVHDDRSLETPSSSFLYQSPMGENDSTGNIQFGHQRLSSNHAFAPPVEVDW